MRRMFFLMALLITAGVFVMLQNFGISNTVSPTILVQEFKTLSPSDGNADGVQPFKTLILTDEGSDLSMQTASNMQAVTTQMKMHTDLNLMSDQLPEFSGYDLVIFTALFGSGDTKVIDALFSYASDGGKVFFTNIANWDSAFSIYFTNLGILEYDEIRGGTAETDTITIKSDFFPTAPVETSISGWAANTQTMVLTLKSDVNIHMSAVIDSESLPLLWSLDYGKGGLMVSIGNMLQNKHNRGIAAGAICTLLERYIYPVYDAVAIFIDDFPAPLPEGFDEKIKAEYNRDIHTFYQDIWWPEMVAIGNAYRLGYTGLLVSTYNDLVQPPFEWKNNDYSHHRMFAASLLRNGWELGLHGYNHNSLMLKSSYGDNEPLYPPWPDIKNMVLSLEELLTLGDNLAKNYKFTTYVPPSNLLSQEGRQAVGEAVPDLYVISGHFLISDDITGVYTQEFGIDEDGVVNLPRLTAGMVPDTSERWVVLNGMAMYGVVSHFIHPDDVLDDERSYGLSWSDMYKGFDEFLDLIRKTMPDIRGMTSTQTAIEIERVEQLGMTLQFSEGMLEVNLTNFVGETHFFARLPAPPVQTEGCTVTQINDFNHSYYVVKATSPDFWIKW